VRAAARELAARWRALSPAQRAPYDAAAAVDVSRFHTAKGAWLLQRRIKNVVRKKKMPKAMSSPFT
jgi:hypothetical protein